MSSKVAIALLISLGWVQATVVTDDSDSWDEIELLDGRVLSGSVTREGEH